MLPVILSSVALHRARKVNAGNTMQLYSQILFLFNTSQSLDQFYFQSVLFITLWFFFFCTLRFISILFHSISNCLCSSVLLFMLHLLYPNTFLLKPILSVSHSASFLVSELPTFLSLFDCSLIYIFSLPSLSFFIYFLSCPVLN